jgi:spore germination protein YaaH
VIRRTLILSALLAAAVPAAAQAAPAAPAPVKGLTARPAGKLSATLSWDAAQGATRYRLIRNGRKVRDAKALTSKVRLTKAKARYQVAAVGRRGRLGRRSTAVTVVRGHSAPRAPVAAAATEVTDSAATLTWGRSKAARSRVAGYRLLSEDRTVRAVKGTRVRLSGLGSSRTLTYRVFAVDSLGWASKPSGPITVVTGHVPPSAPGAPQATSVGDTTLSLSWAASGVRGGTQLRGYRLMRDGVVVKQLPATSADLTNLAPKSSHDWSVAAIDTRGYASAPSPAARIVQADPPPTTGTSHAFLLASTDSSFAAFQKRYRQIGVVYPTFFDCNRQTAAIEGGDDRLIVDFAQDRKVKVLPRFNCQSTAILHTILTDPGTRARWLDSIVASVDQYGYDGVNIDFEAVDPRDRDALTSFIAELSGRLHAKGKLLSQAVSGKFKDVPNHPRSTAFDYQALSQYDDYIFVMAWGIHYSTSAPGAQDDLSWVRQVADYVAAMPNREKFVMGTMLYGFDWPAGGGPANEATALHYGEIQALAAQYGIQPAYDADKDSWHLAYTDASGVPHDVWYSDAAVVARRVALARERGLGVGFWRIGQEDERMWENPQLPGATG